MTSRRYLRTAVAALLLLCGLVWPLSAGLAGEELLLNEWLARPGVRLIAVEFYATWCEPCMKAMPRWKALKEKYYRQGLRVVVVNTQDPDGACRSVGFVPDEYVCDLQGHLSEQFGLRGKLPAAFLWSWQGNLLVQQGHIDEVEKAVEQYLEQAPRVAIEAGGAMTPSLLDALRERLTDDGKVTVVAGPDEAAMLERAKRAQASARFDERLQCEPGLEVPPNALLRASVVGHGKDAFLSLGLHDIQTGCLLQSASAPWDESARRLTQEAVGKLLGKLKQGRLQMPGQNPKRMAALPVQTGPQISGARVEGDENAGKGPQISGGAVSAAVGRLIVQVTPKEASLQVTGPNAFREVGAASWERADLRPGAYTVEAAAAGWEAQTQQVTVVSDDTQIVKLSLQKLGGLEVTGTPAGARVEVRGPDGLSAVQGLPLTIRDAQSGTYTLKVVKAGYEPAEYRATVHPGATEQVVVTLKQPGTLEVRGTPVGAEVKIAGPNGFSLLRGLPVKIEGAASGPYTVTVSRDGWAPQERTLSVRAGNATEWELALVRPVQAPAAGRVATSGPRRCAPVGDRDCDGIPDVDDKCPDDPEDFDNDDDEDGCPEYDRDADGIKDQFDRCPDQPEDRDGFMDEDGCPDVDNDQDGIPDTNDKCPNYAEDKDGFEDADGCPDGDNDNDGIIDFPQRNDQCPDKPETFNGLDDDDGCPDELPPEQLVQSARTTVAQDRFVFRKQILFAANSGTLVGSIAEQILDELAAALKERPEIRAQVEGYCDEREGAKLHRKLSQVRAESVVAALVLRGVARSRLVPMGFGNDRPLDPAHNAAAWEKNRRVEFYFLAP